MATEPFAGPKLKVERAKRHMDDFKTVFRSLNNTDFVRFKLQHEGKPALYRKGGPKTFNVVLASAYKLPDDLRLIVGDSLYNLRSALDQAASRCAVLAGKSPKRTYFPHGTDKAGFEASIAKNCKDVPIIVREAISVLEPYYGGTGFLLRALHDLNLVDKHTDLLVYFVSMGHFSIGRGHYGFESGGLWQNGKNASELDEHFVFNSDDAVKAALTISFGGIESIKDQPVMQVLPQLCDLVTRTIDIIEGECIRSGLIR